MAQEQVDAILKALAQSQNVAADYQNRVAQQKQDEEQRKAAQARFEQERKDALEKLKQDDLHWQLTHQLADATFKLNKFGKENEIKSKVFKGEESYPGFTKLSTTKDASGQEVDEWQLPQEFGGQRIFVPSANSLAAQRGQAKLTEELPKIQANTEEAIKLQNNQATINAAAKTKEQEIANTKDMRDFSQSAALELMRERGAVTLEKLRQTGRENNKTLNPLMDGTNADQALYLEKIADGTYTLKDLKDMGLKDIEISTITNAALKNKVIPLKEPQKLALQQFSSISKVLTDYERFLNLQEESGSVVGGIYKGITLNAERPALAKSIQGSKLVLASVIGAQGKRSSNADAEAMVDKFLPGNYTPKTVNVANYNRLRAELKGGIDTMFSDLSEEQKSIILQKYGVDSLYGPGMENSKPFDPKAYSDELIKRHNLGKGK
jgi:hypothetical protein